MAGHMTSKMGVATKGHIIHKIKKDIDQGIREIS